MSSNITQMPLMSEFVRAYPSFNEERVCDITLYPLLEFRVPTIALANVLETALRETNKKLANEDELDSDAKIAAIKLINHHINSGIGRLEDEGKVISGELLEGVALNNIQRLYNNAAYVLTNDGYTVFNPGYIPPTPSKENH